MREILFKGKRADNGEWAEGAFSKYNWDFWGEREEKPQIIIFSDNEDIDGLWCDVLPETVGQYTGLTDKNGRKIFEGDIVHAVHKSDYAGTKPIDYGIGIVKYYASYYGNASYMIDIIGETGSRAFSAGIEEGVEIIGNIHDNPELLEGGK